MTTIIIAAIGLIILILLVAVSISKFKSFSDGTGKVQSNMQGNCATPGTSRQCYNQGGSQIQKEQNCVDDGGVVIPGGPWNDCSAQSICCSI